MHPCDSRSTITKVADWWFRDRRTGRITIAQFPNVALWAYLATVVLRRVFTTGLVARAIEWAGVATLVWWALDELLRGVNPWRRALGVAGCIAATLSALSILRR